jgi:hypothetical protein
MQTANESSEKPRSDQLHELRSLADARGVTFAWPQTSADADAELRHLRAQQASSFAERAIERRAVAHAMAARGGAAKVRDTEIVGYGSSAHWAVGQ